MGQRHIVRGLTHAENPSPRVELRPESTIVQPKLRGRQDFANTQVVLVCRRRSIVDAYRCPTQWSRGVLHLYPESVVLWRQILQILMNDGLIGAGGSIERPVKISPHADNPGAIAGGGQACSGSPSAGVPCASGADRSRAVRARSVYARESHHGNR